VAFSAKEMRAAAIEGRMSVTWSLHVAQMRFEGRLCEPVSHAFVALFNVAHFWTFVELGARRGRS